MKITIWKLLTTNRHGDHIELFGSREDAEASAGRYCRERWDWLAKREKVNLANMSDAEVIKWCFGDYETPSMVSDDDSVDIESEEIDISLTPPADPVEAARMAVEALILARACLKAAGSSRTVERVAAALSSAKGAVRAAEYRKNRISAEKIFAKLAEIRNG